MNLNRSLHIFIFIIISIALAFIILGSMEEVETFRNEYMEGEAIYLFDSNEGSLVQIPLYLDQIVDTDNTRQIVEYVLGLLTNGVRSSEYEPTISDPALVKYYIIDGRNVILNLARDYQSMPKEKRLLMVSSIVTTIVSFDAIDSVEFYIEGIPMKDDLNQTVGKLYGRDIVMNSGTIEQVESTNEWIVYLPTEDGKNLERRSVVLTSSHYEKQEEVIMNYLLRQDNRPIMGKGTKLVDIYTNNGICFIDMDSSFQSIPLPDGMSERIAIYSIVNSLCELDNVDYVQFMVDGEIVDTFRGTFSLDRLLEVNYVLVK